MEYLFKLEIVKYDEVKGFFVRYTPTDVDLRPVSTWIKLEPSYDNKDKILQRLKELAPHYDWKTQEDAKQLDHAEFHNLVGEVHDVDPAELNVDTELTGNSLRPEFAPELAPSTPKEAKKL